MDPVPAAPIDHRQIALDHFGIEGSASPLPGYDDSNALIETSVGDRYVLRISVPDPDVDRITFVDRAMNIVKNASFDAPSSQPTVHGDQFASLPDNRVARLLSWVAGVTAEDAGRPPEAAVSVGRTAGEMVRVLAPLVQPSPQRDATWDPGRATEIITQFQHHVLGEPRQALVERILTATHDVPFGRLPVQTIHSDLNAGNVVLTGHTVSGVIDFEDVVTTIRIGELSVACAYAMLVQKDPVSVAMDVIRGYRQVASITEDEATHLFALTMSRMAVSVCVAASRPPGNPHQHHTSEIMWTLLTRLLDEDIDALSARFKEAALS